MKNIEMKGGIINMNVWMISTVILGVLLLGAVFITAYVGEEKPIQGCSGSGCPLGGCNSENNCGSSSCGAVNGSGECGCGKR